MTALDPTSLVLALGCLVAAALAWTATTPGAPGSVGSRHRRTYAASTAPRAEGADEGALPGARPSVRRVLLLPLPLLPTAPLVVLVLTGGDGPLPGPVLGTLSVAGACLAFAAWLHRRRAAQAAHEREAVRAGTACELLVGELGAGVPPDVALRRVAETHPSLAPVVGAATMSAEVPPALRALAARSRIPSWARVADAWEVSTRSGAGLATLLAQVAAGERDAAARRRLVRTELADAQATARLMAVLPWLLVGAASIGGGGAATFLTSTWAGVGCAAVGSVFAAAGLLWMERIEREGLR